MYVCYSPEYMDIKTLVKRAQTKDSHALETLYNMHYPKMLGLCIRITKEDEDTAKDLVHDAFVLAFSSLHNLNTPQRFGEWLSTIVRNVALKYMERKGKICFVSITDEKETTVDSNVSSDSTVNIQDILSLIDKLPNGYGKVLRLYAIEGFSHKEIAAILGIEPHSSSSQLSRAKAMLRKIIEHILWAVILFLITAIPLYIIVLRNKQLRQHKHEMVETEKTEMPTGTIATPKPTVARNGIRKPNYKNMAVSNVTTVETKDTTFVSDSVTVEMIVSNVTEQKQDSTENVDSIMPQITYSDYELAMEDKKKKTNQWQMLAAGSVGPALAQNIYRLISTGKPDIDSEAPTFPENVNTWEDYSRYLHIKEHEDMPEDTLAMIEIADHNQGDIIEREQHDRPITFGISLSTPPSKKWSFETGLQYSILKSRSIMGNGEYYIGKKQNIHYLSIPLRVSYHLADWKHLSAYSSAGLQLNIPVYGKVNSKYIVGNAPAYINSWHITPPIQWSTNFSMGLQYKFLPKWTLYVEPTLYWYIPNSSSTHTIWTEHPTMFSVPFGIRFTW
ncbi:MAG: sigma-70 family RNA polymerase sigma factor [Bacteroides sp.]|nr:sigma-70 family RNA polymerase sigma factor [Roseburia sp.]MCM1346969.1 sigma-70 family RNA polymerase sigma factor [Bacteroides sp.]MCM1421595.1 sigma-70 family RNA polymerase sigma factor [Bacteroides sp.]